MSAGKTLLILGSKPKPALPSPACYHALACANASGRSARRYGLPDPLFTVMTAVLTSGKSSDEHSLCALAGLATDTLYHLPRPKAEIVSPIRAVWRRWKERRMSPSHMRQRLDQLGYRFRRMEAWPASRYHALILDLCGGHPSIVSTISEKQPSTGLFALAVGMALDRFDRFILAGFDLTLNHDYGTNPLIDERGSAESAHARTDALVLSCLQSRHGTIVTTEPSLNERAGVPLIDAECADAS